MSLNQGLGKIIIAVVVFLSLSFQANMGLALDTDIYQANVKQNAYILLDNSGSMAWPVYESSIDYAAMFDALKVRSGVSEVVSSYPSFVFPAEHFERNKIYLVEADNIGVSKITINGETRVFPGDAGNPDRNWFVNSVVDLHTYIDSNGNLIAEEGEEKARLTTDVLGNVLLDGVALPLGQGGKLHDYTTLFDGSIIDGGIGGQLKAPGYYFSALEGVAAGNHVPVEDDNDDEDGYFLVTGNWLNMQHVCNLVKNGEPAWQTETFPISEGDWMVTDRLIDVPDGDVVYQKNLNRTDVRKFINHPGASQIQIHFSMFDVNSHEVGYWVGHGWNKRWVTESDWVKLYSAGGNQIVRYNNENSPAGAWSVTIPGDTVEIALTSNSDSYLGKGYTVDKYRVIYSSGTYQMQSRLDVAKDALLYVVDEMRGKINWGFATFNYNGTEPNGATIGPYLNPVDNDDTNRAAIAQAVKNVSPKYGTPLGEALQDVFERGYHGRKNVLEKLLCRRNFVIAVSDGFPSGDDLWNKISGKTFTDEDEDGFTADPAQYSDPPPNYYDDVAHWMYTHSWLDKTAVADPATSYENVISHQIAFGAIHPLMQDAAEEAGGEYITAYNKTQLVNAFHSLALMISQAISFTAPVVSVDAANKVQNGDDLYMGQFLPMDATYWPGNLKKFVLGDGSAERPDRWMIYDAKNNEAIDRSGMFLDNTATFWGNDEDPNDNDNYGAPDIKEDGAGEVLTERVVKNFTTGNFYARNIKTYVNGNFVSFDRTLDPTVFGLDSTAKTKRDKIVNWVYGYTFDSDETIDGTTGEPKGVPIAARDWALGAIVHSRPTVIDYYNASDLSQVDVRYVVAGADDGMLHVFNDADGSEVFAFVPADVLPKLKNFETLLHQPLVDGGIKLHREGGKPKYLIFGLRRGGASYWALDVSDPNAANWTVAWVFTGDSAVSADFHGELVQSWSDVEVAKIRTAPDTFINVAIFSGGYDPIEDSFPEPFLDMDNSGTPYRANGTLDSSEWSKTNSNQDVNGNGVYDLYNSFGDFSGRAIFVVDVDTGKEVFSVKYGTNNPATLGEASSVAAQTRSDFKYCFPASPSVVSLNQAYSYTLGGETVSGRISNVLAAIYAPDIYGNLFRITYDYEAGKKWQVRHLFSANPGSNNVKDQLRTSSNTQDVGRKVFYGPAVSWRGSGRFFQPANYYYPNTHFLGTDVMASVFFGTGDREHPSYQLVKNRVYAVYDDLPVTTSSGEEITTAPYTERDLLNVTCDDLGLDTVLAGATVKETWTYKTSLDTLLTDDVVNTKNTDPMEIFSGENDAKGWYIILEKQGVSPDCDHCAYVNDLELTVGGRDYHYGEKVLSKLSLFAGRLYFTTYQPAYDNPCQPQGNAFNYALNYLNGAAALNLNKANDDLGGDDPIKKDLSDRYDKHTGVKGLPSNFEIVVRNGEAGAMSSIGGAIVGGGDGGGGGGGDFQIPGPDNGIDLYYWIER